MSIIIGLETKTDVGTSPKETAVSYIVTVLVEVLKVSSGNSGLKLSERDGEDTSLGKER